MARQLITITKFIKGLDSELDRFVNAIDKPEDLTKLINSSQSGRAMLYWASYYDPWQMGDSFHLDRFGIDSKTCCDRVISVDLTSIGWQSLPKGHFTPNQHDEERWLLTQLREAHQIFADENHRATLLLSRLVLGASLGDDELLDR